MPKKNIYIISAVAVLVAVALVFLLIGLKFGKLTEKKAWQVEISKKQEEIKNLQSFLEIFFPPLPEEIYNLSGKVTETKDNAINVEAQIRVSRFPLPGGAETEKQNIKVIITDQTKITEFDLNLNPLLPDGKIRPETILNFSDIKAGDDVSVVSAENIKGKKEISASQVQIIR